MNKAEIQRYELAYEAVSGYLHHLTQEHGIERLGLEVIPDKTKYLPYVQAGMQKVMLVNEEYFPETLESLIGSGIKQSDDQWIHWFVTKRGTAKNIKRTYYLIQRIKTKDRLGLMQEHEMRIFQICQPGQQWKNLLIDLMSLLLAEKFARSGRWCNPKLRQETEYALALPVSRFNPDDLSPNETDHKMDFLGETFYSRTGERVECQEYPDPVDYVAVEKYIDEWNRLSN